MLRLSLAALACASILSTNLAAQCGGTAVASVSSYNGSGSNAVAIMSLSPPLLGTSWSLGIDHTTFMTGAQLDWHVVALAPNSQTLLPFGEILVDTSFNLTLLAITPGNNSFPLPADSLLCGVHLFVQGASFDGTDVRLTDALDAVLGDS